MTIRSQALAGVRWTTLAMLLRAAFMVIQMAILARLLPPQDFGLLALAMTVVTTLTLFTDVGLSNAIIHFRDITERQLSSLFWLNLLVGIAISVALVLASPTVARFYGVPEVRDVLLFLSPTFIILAAGQQLRALAQKQLRFNRLAKVEIAAGLAGLITAVVSGVAGAGVYALAAASLASAFTMSALSWIVLSDGWRPQFVLALGEIGSFVRFGGHMIGANLANTLTAQADVIIAGRLFALGQVGLYFQPRELSMRVMMVINPIVTRVGMPLIAEVQADRRAIARIYLQTMRMTASINFPFYGALALFSREVVVIVFGDQWLAAADLLCAVAIWCAVRSVGNPVGSLLVGTGSSRRMLWGAVVMLPLTAAFAWIGGAYGGPLGLPIGLAVLYALAIPGFWLFLVRPVTGIGFAAYHGALVPPAVATLAAVAAAYVAVVPLDTTLLRLSAGLAAGAAVYLATSFLLNRSWLDAMVELVRPKRLPEPAKP